MCNEHFFHNQSDEGCCGQFQGRRFITKTEKIKNLEKYKDMLQKEIQGVEEVIRELGT